MAEAVVKVLMYLSLAMVAASLAMILWTVVASGPAGVELGA